MSNFLLRSPDAVLIHIPKNGGTSIRRGVWAGRYEGPVFGEVPAEWAGLFKFAFVRHPLDRLVSSWRMFTGGSFISPKDYALGWLATKTGIRRLSPPASNRTIPGMSLDQFLDVVTDETISHDTSKGGTVRNSIRHHTIPQTHPFNCLSEADFVGRYERIDSDFRHIATRLGTAPDLPHLRRTVRRDWRSCMTASQIERAAKFYADDFKLLEYSI